MSKKCGYSFWGYLGDTKYTRDGKEASTPDGNAFYSWCIIREFQKRGYEVTQIMPDRDEVGFILQGEKLFSSWAQEDRLQAYLNAKKLEYYGFMDYIRDMGESIKNNSNIVHIIETYVMYVLETNCRDMEFILHEYRMWIPGRNDYDSILGENWQPDYLIQECLFRYCSENQKKLILFDLDYKLDYRTCEELVRDGCDVYVFELGTKWQEMFKLYPWGKFNARNVRQVQIPFDFDHINDIDVSFSDKTEDLVYVGNRYERDWCIDKYISKDLRCKVYGNWLESGRDSKERWPNINFGKRLQTRDMKEVYGNAQCTILFAKKEYCEYGFMTARILEAVFYGCVPLFIEEYGEDVIKRYAGKFARYLTVRNAYGVKYKENELNGNFALIRYIIEYLREHLKFMDVKNFVDVIEEVVR